MQKVLAIIILLLTSCSQPKPKFKTLDTGFFSIQAPAEWHLVDTTMTYEVIGTTKFSSKRGNIAVGQNDTLNFELGFFAIIPQEYKVLVLNETDTSYFLTSDLNDTTQDNKPTGDMPKGILPYLVSTQYSYINFHGKEAVLHKPVKTGTGITGINIDTLWSNNGIKESFILYGKNLKPPNERELLEAIKTLKFCKPR